MLPVLTTSRLVLRPATDDDLERLLRLLRAPEVRRYLCDDVEMTREQVAAMLRESVADWSAGIGLWMISSHQGPPWGSVGLRHVADAVVPRLAGEVEPTIAVAPARWGHGYAAEALAAVIGYAFRTLGRQRLVALVDEPNAASHRLMVKMGFAPLGVCAGPRYPLRLYRLTPSAFRGCSFREDPNAQESRT